MLREAQEEEEYDEDDHVEEHSEVDEEEEKVRKRDQAAFVDGSNDEEEEEEEGDEEEGSGDDVKKKPVKRRGRPKQKVKKAEFAKIFKSPGSEPRTRKRKDVTEGEEVDEFNDPEGVVAADLHGTPGKAVKACDEQRVKNYLPQKGEDDEVFQLAQILQEKCLKEAHLEGRELRVGEVSAYATVKIPVDFLG